MQSKTNTYEEITIKTLITSLALIIASNSFALGTWECVDTQRFNDTDRISQCGLLRMPIKNGWLVKTYIRPASITFVFDPQHQWDIRV